MIPEEDREAIGNLHRQLHRLADSMQGNPFTATISGGFVRHLPDGRTAFLRRDRTMVGPTEDMVRQMVIDTIYSWRYWRDLDGY